MAGDWGTGLYGAPKIADEIKKQGPFDLLMHLGDVYYSGTEEEVQERFLDIWPASAGKINRALNSNHEMYSGGFAYFDLALPAFGQESSYFAFQNTHWLLVGLDTAYVDHDMDNEQVAWLKVVVSQAGDRKVLLFSHQQLFSRLDNQGPKLVTALQPLLESKRLQRGTGAMNTSASSMKSTLSMASSHGASATAEFPRRASASSRRRRPKGRSARSHGSVWPLQRIARHVSPSMVPTSSSRRRRRSSFPTGL
jgi:hypothetical protein